MSTAKSLLCAGAALLAALPAQAQVFAVATSGDGARVVLHDKSGPCVGSARLAEHIAPNGDRVPGCWLLANDIVKVSFLDGERGNIPVAHLKKAQSL